MQLWIVHRALGESVGTLRISGRMHWSRIFDAVRPMRSCLLSDIPPNNPRFSCRLLCSNPPCAGVSLSRETDDGTRLASNLVSFQRLFCEVVHLSVEMKRAFWNAWLRDAYLSHPVSAFALIVCPSILYALIKTTIPTSLILFGIRASALIETIDRRPDRFTRAGRPRRLLTPID
jgi:hypothetical protein